MANKIHSLASLAIMFVALLPVQAIDIRELPCFWFDQPTNPEIAAYLTREKAFSNYSWIYSILSANAYVKKDEEQRIPLPVNSDWIELGKVEKRDEEQGFYARSWFRSEGNYSELIISFRGTNQPWKDFYNGNFVFIPYLFGRTQFDSAISFTNAVIEEAKLKNLTYSKIIFTGHSLGGGLAQYSQRFYHNSQAIVFDPSPNKGRIYSLFVKKKKANAVRVYEKGEVLEYFRKSLDPDLKWDWTPEGVGKSTIWMDFYDDGILEGHSIDDLAMSLIRVSASTGNRGALSVIRQIEMKLDKSDLPCLECSRNIYRKELRSEVLEVQ